VARLRPRADAPTIDAKASSRLTVLGVPIDRLPGDSMLRRIGDAAENRRGVVVSYVNAHSLNLACRDPAYRRVLTASDFVLNDGIGLQIAAIVQRGPFPESLNGSDLTLRILEMAAARGWSVFVLGARRGVAAQAADRLKERIPDRRYGRRLR
jgi:UDP-N-acetyl-D-mannosaminuronic acid transferase (WecB/TagA/CpsF family)